MRLPFRFHGTARPFVDVALVQRVVLGAELGLDAFVTPLKSARIGEFLVEKRSRRIRTKKPRSARRCEEVAPTIAEDSEDEFDDDVEPLLKLSLIEHCSTSFDFGETCTICEEEIRDGRFPFALACSHSFCSECWLQHIQLSMSEKMSEVGCMEPHCSQHLSPDAASSLLDSESAEIYRRFVDDISTTLRPLSCPICAAEVENSGSETIACRCGTVLCSLCGSIDHTPVSCDVYKQYRVVRDGKDSGPDDSWYPTLKDLCKCPHCGNYAVKNGGCNWVHCICNKSYCYVCSREWSMNHRSHCHKRKFKVQLIDVTPTPPPAPVTPSLIARTLAARELIVGRRKELNTRLSVLGKIEAIEVHKNIAELTHLLELAVLSADRYRKSRSAEISLRMAFFAFANTSDGNVACLRLKCQQLRQRVAEIRKSL